MSTPFYDLASLVLVPSGYKAQKVYAQKPLTTDGQLSFSRASTATRVNSAGLIETVSSNVPRLDYLNSSCPRLLLEPQRTNLVANSENTSGYSTFGSAFTQNTATSPQGYVNADTIAGNGASTQIFAATAITFPSAGAATISFFAKANTASVVDLNFDAFTGSVSSQGIYDLTNGTASGTGASIQNYGNGWYRCILTGTIDAGDLSGALAIDVRASVANQFWPSAAAANGKSAFVWGFQAEQGAYATSYIPTLGAAVTRGADACSKTGISSLIGQTEGTVFVEVDYSTLSGLNMFLSIRPDASNKVELYRDGGAIYGEITASSSFAITASKAVGTHKIAFAYKSGSSALYIDGALVSQNTTTFSFTSSLVDIAINARSGGAFNEAANYKQALLFKTRLTNAQLAELTTL